MVYPAGTSLEIFQPHEVAPAIARNRETVEFRPTAQMLLHSTDTEGFTSFASIVSLKRDEGQTSDFWWLPQGGITEGETPEEAAARELLEEIPEGIDPVAAAEFTILGAIEYETDMKGSSPTKKERDWSKSRGKLLIACAARITTAGALKPNPKENVAKAEMLTSFRLKFMLMNNGLFAPSKKDKADFSRAMIDRVLEISRGPEPKFPPLPNL